MSPVRGDMQDVVLDEVDGLGDPAGPHARGSRLPVEAGSDEDAGWAPVDGAGARRPAADRGGRLLTRRRTSVGATPRRRRLWTAGVAVAVVLGAAAVDARGRADLAPLVAPGALAPVDGPLRELWRDPDLSMWDFDQVGELLVGAAQRGDEAVEVVGIDRATGAERWSAPLLADGNDSGGWTCTTPDAPADSDADADDDGRTGAGGSPGAARVTVCVVVDAMGPLEGVTPAGLTQPTASRMVLVDPATGRVLREEAVEPSTFVAALGADIVVSHLDDDGHLHVRRTDPWGDGVRWTFTSPEPLPTGEYGQWAWIMTMGDTLLAGGESGWVLSADGEPLRPWEPPPRGDGWAEVLGNGLLVVPASGGLASDVSDLRSGSTFRIEGRPLAPAVDDGSADVAVLAQTSRDELTAYSGRTGRALWSVPDAGAGAAGLVVVDGRVVRARDDGLVAHDAATGRTLWETSLAAAAQYTLFTDGRLALCVVLVPDRGRVLGAYGLDDGRLRWDVELPDGVDYLLVVDGQLYGHVGGGLAAFG